jgi:D-3-phosphoglycerate dehydrogenase
MLFNRVFVTPPMLADMPSAFAVLHAKGVEVVFNQGPYPLDEARLLECLAREVAVIGGLDRFSDAVFRACPQLKVVSRNGVGVDNVDLDSATRHGVLVTVPLGANSTSVAELTIGLIVALVRQVIPIHFELQQGVWKREPGMELSGKTLGIIGLGWIGKRVATRALGLEMRVIANDILPDYEFAGLQGIPVAALDEVLAQSDILSLHVPLTVLTEKMINEENLAKMKLGSYLINTARAAVIDPYALAAALDSGHILGAAIDVHFAEGGKEGRAHEALASRPNVITTPHLGSYTHEALFKTTQGAVMNLVEILEGRPPQGLINKEAWR